MNRRTTKKAVAAAAVAVSAFAGTVIPATADPLQDLDRAVPIDLPFIDSGDRYAQRTTGDGWVLHAANEGEEVRVVPSLDGSPTTGEAFGSLTGRVWIDGKGSPKLDKATMEVGYQVGCAVDVSEGADVEVASKLGVSPSVGANAGLEPKVTASLSPDVTAGATGGGLKLGEIGGEVAAPVGVEAGVDGNAEVAPTISMHLDPGGITDVPLVSMPVDLDYMRARGGFTGAHIKVEGCAGVGSIRSYVKISSATPTSVDAVAIYGKVNKL